MMKQRMKKTVALLLSFCLFITSLVIPATAEDNTQPQKVYINDEVTRVVDLTQYIVLDLAQGNITINASTYSGYQASIADGKVTWTQKTSVTWTAGQKFYIIQSTCKKSIEVEGNSLKLTSVDINEQLFTTVDMTNDTPAKNAMNDWQTAADRAGRTATKNHISLPGGNAEYNITIDDIWSTAQYCHDGKSGTSVAGGLCVQVNSYTNMKVSLYLAGDNRLANLYYNSQSDNASYLTVNDSSYEGTGLLVVIGDPTDTKTSSLNTADGANYYTQAASNNWNSVIGSKNNSTKHAFNLNFDGGIIYAGAHENENCSAIGGGGNGQTKIRISGENTVVTAVAHTTGTAIGAGIAHTGQGVPATINIEGGTVNAYNFGLWSYKRVTTRNFGGSYTKDDIPYAAGTAIGGGGSMVEQGEKGTVNITGGTVTAWSRGGTAIGGGNTVMRQGGAAEVRIGKQNDPTSSPTVYAYSEEFTFKNYQGQDVLVSAATAIGGGKSVTSYGGQANVYFYGGTAVEDGIGGGSSTASYGGKGTVEIYGGSVTVNGGIGGGNSTEGNGGDAELNVYGGYISAGGVGGGNSVSGNGGTATVNVTGGRVTSTADIGGGRSTNGYGGTAKVKVTDGTLVSVGIGGGYSEKNGYATGTVTVNGGSLNSSMAAVPKNSSGELLYLTRITFFLNGVAQTATKIDENSLVFDANMTDKYKTNSIWTDSTGMIYLWLPADAFVKSGEISGVPYAPDSTVEQDRDVDAKDVGAFHGNTAVSRYILSVAGSGYYSLFFDAECKNPFSGAVITESGNFTYYLKVREDVTLTPIFSSKDAQGNDILSSGTALADRIGDPVTDEDGVSYLVYKHTVHLSGDLAVCFSATMQVDGESKTYYILDLCNGNVSVTQQQGGLVIEQNGSKMTVTSGTVYLTSAGYPTSNTLTVNAEDGFSGAALEIMADELNMVAKEEAIVIGENANVSMSFGAQNNIIYSSSSTPIHVAEGGTLQINMSETKIEGTERTEKDALQIGSNNDQVALITGAGKLVMNDNGGFLTVGTPRDGVKQIAVGTYDIKGKNNNFSAELYTGAYSYQVIGFISEGELHSNEEQPQPGKTFSARGYKTGLNGVALNGAEITGGKFTFTLDSAIGESSIGSFRLQNSKGETLATYQMNGTNSLPSGITCVVSNDNKTLQVTVSGDFFQDGNLWIYAAAAGKIAYDSSGVEVVYDGMEHSITVSVENTDIFTVYYSLTRIDANTALNGLTTSPIGIRDATVGTAVYFVIVPKEGYSYDRVYDSEEIIITKGKNAWVQELTCPHIVIGATPDAKADSKWGEVTYTYYVDAEGNQPISPSEIAQKNENELSAGATYFTFYVRATVVANGDNYDAIESDLIEFHVVKVSAYIALGKVLSEITPDQASAGGTLDVPHTGAFSVRYSVTRTGTDKLIFTADLPVGTKLTMIDMTDSTPQYRWYVVEEAITEILLSNFTVMGSTNKHNSDQPVVTYQFVVEYTGLTASMGVKLNDSIQLTVNPKTAVTEELNTLSNGTEKIKTEQKGNTVFVQVSPTLVGSSDKFLAFSLNEGALEGASAVLKNNNGAEVNAAWCSDDAVVFKLGDSSAEIQNATYTLELTNLKPNASSYTITADARLLTAETYDYPYVLQNQTDKNHATAQFTVAEAPTLSVTGSFVSPEASATTGTKVITKAGEDLLEKLSLTVKSNTEVTLTVYKKNGENYQKIAEPQTLSVQDDKGNYVLNSAMLSTNHVTLPDGIYRLTFTTQDESVSRDYYIIVISD